MRKLLYTIVIFCFSYPLFAQGPINIGVKFGANRSTMNFVTIDEIYEENVNHYLAGAFVRGNLGRLYVQPEVYFNTKGGIIQPVSDNQFNIPTSVELNYQTLDVPVLIGVKIINKPIFNLRVNAGPVFSYITASDFSEDLADLTTEHLNDNYVGWQFGAGVDVWFVSLDARIEGTGNLLNDRSSLSAKNQVFLFSAAIKLF